MKGIVVKIRVKYLSELLQSVTGSIEEDIVLKEGSTLRDLLKRIADLHGERLREWLFNEKGEFSGNILVLVNGEISSNSERKLRDGDTVILTIPFDGG